MYRLLLIALCALPLCMSAEEPARPAITGIDHVSFYTTAPEQLAVLYSKRLGLSSGAPLEPRQNARYLVGRQWIGYSPAPAANEVNRLDHIAFATSSVDALQRYLVARGIAVTQPIQRAPDGSRSFAVRDFEGYTIEFVEHAPGRAVQSTAQPISRRLIHVGIIVRERAAADRFYRDLLGFRLYWYGGMEAQRTDWVAMQVPNGTDWLEYMLNPSAAPDAKLSGVLNHISLGVADMQSAEAKLVARGWKSGGDEHSQMGLDGKRQLNLFDHDLSRVELMEFRPTQKPCCSDFRGPHPSEKD